MKKILSLVLSLIIVLTAFNGMTAIASEDVAFKGDYLAARVEIKDKDDSIFVTQPYLRNGITESHTVQITTAKELKTFCENIVFGELETAPESYDYTSGADYGKIYMCDYVIEDFDDRWLEEFEDFVREIIASDEDELSHYDIEDLACIWEEVYNTSADVTTDGYFGDYRYNLLWDMELCYDDVAAFFNEDGSFKDDVFDEELAEKYNAKALLSSVYAFSDVEFMDVPNSELLYLMYEYERVMSNPICYIASGGCEYNPDISWEIYGKGILEISGEGELCEECGFVEYGQEIKECIINEGITSVGDYTFDGIGWLGKVTLPDTLKEIGDRAFYDTYITTIDIPDNVTKIGYGAFKNCYNLKSVRLPKNLKVLETDLFYDCLDLAFIEIPESVEIIEDFVFHRCRSLTNVEIPKNVKWIGERVFDDCTSLESLTVDADNEYYFSDGNCIVEKATKTLVTACNGFEIPTGRKVEHIGDYAFYYLWGNYEIVIPDGVRTIGSCAFTSTGLAEITLPNSLEMLDESAFSNVSLKNVYYKGTESEWERVIVGRSNDALDEAVFHFETRPASEEACNGVSWETGVDGTLIISGEGEICSDCGFKSYPEYIEKCDIKEGITAINEGAFDGCYLMTEITIPATVLRIDKGAFENCGLLSHIYYQGTEDEWNEVLLNEDLNGVTVCFATEKEGFSISGTVKCHGDKNETVTVELLKDGALITNQKFKGNVNTYSFDGLDSGSYSVIVYKTKYFDAKHCSRRYNVYVEDDNVTKNVEILLYGDVTGDGIINNLDVMQMNRKLANLRSVFDTDEFYYLEQVGNISGINTPGPTVGNEDIIQINRYLNNMSSLFDILV